MRIAWLTDIHLNFLREEQLRHFLATLADQSPDAAVISGDIAESPDVVWHLKRMAETLRRPIYFVLGNHDFYRGSIARTRKSVTEAAAESEFLVYLTANGVVELTPTTALVGHDGWGDTRLGDYERSNVMLNDFLLIEELKKWDWTPDRMDRDALRLELEQRGDEAGRHFARVLPEALKSHPRVIALTHVPPFREAAWYAGQYSDNAWLPFFACKAAGDAMQAALAGRPDREVLVLCGHTHGSGQSQIAPNLRVLTGGAQYGEPAVQQMLEIA